MKPVIIIAIAFLLIPVGMTHADIKDGEYFCNSENKEIAIQEYYQSVEKFNKVINANYVHLEGLTPEILAKNLVNPTVTDIENKAKCLKDNFGIEPDSVIKFSDESQEVLMANPISLMKYAPELSNYATVPEFGSIAMLILVISVISIVIFTRRFNVIRF